MKHIVMPEKKVSIYDIAKRLGISASTVSRALHDNPAISEEVKKSVKQVAKELNFRPNHLAVALKTGKIRTIGIVVPQINRTYFVEAIAGVEKELYKAGYDLIIASTGNLYERERNIVDSLSNGKVIGVIAAVAAESTDYSHYQRLIDNNIPVVFFDRKVPGLEASSVVQDDYDAGYNATVHLIEQGCRNIFHFRGPQNVSVWSERDLGYRKALEDNGMKVGRHSVHTAITTEEEGRRFAEKLLSYKELPDGILFSGDFAARGAMEVLQAAGVRIPQDIAIVGFVNEPWDSLLTPPLTSVEQFSGKIGETAAKLMEETLDGMPRRDVVYKTQLIVRESSLRGKYH